MTKLTETAPERIWLQISDDETDLDCGFSEIERAAEITWCAESVVASEVGYVHADLLESANARIAELEDALLTAKNALESFMNLPIEPDMTWIEMEKDDIAVMDSVRVALGLKPWLEQMGIQK